MTKRYLVEETDDNLPRQVEAHGQEWLALSKVDEEFDPHYRRDSGAWSNDSDTGAWFDIFLAVPYMGREDRTYPMNLKLIRVVRDRSY